MKKKSFYHNLYDMPNAALNHYYQKAYYTSSPSLVSKSDRTNKARSVVLEEVWPSDAFYLFEGYILVSARVLIYYLFLQKSCLKQLCFWVEYSIFQIKLVLVFTRMSLCLQVGCAKSNLKLCNAVCFKKLYKEFFNSNVSFGFLNSDFL